MNVFPKCEAALVAVLAVMAAAPDRPARAEALLVYTPVVEEVLGTMREENGVPIFIDCKGQRHDPAEKTVKPTQDTCNGPVILFGRAFGPEKFIGQEIFAQNGDQVGEVVGLEVARKVEDTGLLVSQGGFLGIGERLVQIARDKFGLSAEDGRLVVQMSRDEFENLPAVQ